MIAAFSRLGLVRSVAALGTPEQVAERAAVALATMTVPTVASALMPPALPRARACLRIAPCAVGRAKLIIAAVIGAGFGVCDQKARRVGGRAAVVRSSSRPAAVRSSSRAVRRVAVVATGLARSSSLLNRRRRRTPRS